VVRADSAAHAARGRAVLHHSHWIAFALTRIVPDVALGSIGIGANGLLTDATRGGALVVHPLRVLVALTLGGPTWALARFVLAQAFADAACDWTIERHITRVVVAAARRCPALALFLDIFALCESRQGKRKCWWGSGPHSCMCSHAVYWLGKGHAGGRPC